MIEDKLKEEVWEKRKELMSKICISREDIRDLREKYDAFKIIVNKDFSINGELYGLYDTYRDLRRLDFESNLSREELSQLGESQISHPNHVIKIDQLESYKELPKEIVKKAKDWSFLIVGAQIKALEEFFPEDLEEHPELREAVNHTEIRNYMIHKAIPLYKKQADEENFSGYEKEQLRKFESYEDRVNETWNNEGVKLRIEIDKDALRYYHEKHPEAVEDYLSRVDGLEFFRENVLRGKRK